MSNFHKIFICFALLLIFISQNVHSQDDWWKNKKFKDVKAKIKYDDCKKTFKEIAAGLNYSNVNSISIYFDEQVFLDIISFEKGYYSRSQAESIISNFMDYFKVINFKYYRSYYKNSFALAIGKYKYDIGNGPTELTVSVSLIYNGDSWILDQLNIY